MSLNDYLDATVIKRAGEKAKFYPYKINLVLKQLSVDNDAASKIKHDIEYRLASNHSFISAKAISKIFIQDLKATGNDDLADKYIEYHHKEVENFKNATNPAYKLNQYFGGDKNIINENANKDHRVYNTQRDLIAGTASRAIGLQMLPDIVAKAHLRGDIHWHDLDYSPVLPETNCSLPNFKDMLANGFKLGNAKISSPKSIQTAVAHVTQIIANIGGSQYGY